MTITITKICKLMTLLDSVSSTCYHAVLTVHLLSSLPPRNQPSHTYRNPEQLLVSQGGWTGTGERAKRGRRSGGGRGGTKTANEWRTCFTTKERACEM